MSRIRYLHHTKHCGYDYASFNVTNGILAHVDQLGELFLRFVQFLFACYIYVFADVFYVSFYQWIFHFIRRVVDLDTPFL